jgi:hypothetical protein
MRIGVSPPPLAAVGRVLLRLGRDLPVASDSICPITSQFLHNIYRLTPVLIAPKVMMSGVKPRWLSYLSRFLTIPSVTDSPVSAAFTSQSL